MGKSTGDDKAQVIKTPIGKSTGDDKAQVIKTTQR